MSLIDADRNDVLYGSEDDPSKQKGGISKSTLNPAQTGNGTSVASIIRVDEPSGLGPA